MLAGDNFNPSRHVHMQKIHTESQHQSSGGQRGLQSGRAKYLWASDNTHLVGEQKICILLVIKLFPGAALLFAEHAWLSLKQCSARPNQRAVYR